MTLRREAVDADVVVVGAGPAGIAAAVRAAESGRRVVVADESPNVGGQIWRHRPGEPAPAAARRWLARLASSGARVLAGTSVVDAHGDPHGDAHAGFELLAERHDTAMTLRASQLVLATGARERFLPFPGWTLPGVVGIGGAQALLKAGMAVTGKSVVIAGSGPLLLPVAASLRAAGGRVTLVAEQAPMRRIAGFVAGLWRRPAALLDAARYRARFAGTPYRLGWWVTEARGTTALHEVVLTDGRGSRVVRCDLLCTGYGLVPNVELPRLLGCAVERGVVVVDDEQRTSVPGVFCAGEPTGIGGVDLALVEGEVAGLYVAGRSAEARTLFARRSRLRRLAAAMEHAFTPRAELPGVVTSETIVCRCEDVPFGAVRPEWSPRQAKLYTRAGMGPCQGRVCGPSLSFLCGWPADTVRAPVEPARLETLARARGAMPADSAL
jgi:NADPH-dependent 2,4-dienoyl-CoA reductase/sulfur reductase-like enzyme